MVEQRKSMETTLGENAMKIFEWKTKDLEYDINVDKAMAGFEKISNSERSAVVDVTGDRSKVQCCKEQYCIGTWNVRSMNQDKLEVTKQENSLLPNSDLN